MSWLTEDITTLLIVLGLVELALAALLYQSGRGVLIGIMAVVLLLGGAAFLTEMLIVTERERVEETLFGVVEAVEANDLEGVLSYIGPDAQEVRSMAKGRLKLVTIIEAKITDTPKIEINELTSPPSAHAAFMGRVKGQLKMGNQYGDTFIARFNVELRRHDGQWKIVTVETDSPMPR